MNSKVNLLNEYWTDIYFHMHYQHKEQISHQVVRILQLVEKQDGIGVKEIASFLDISQNTASEHVKRMCEKNYLIKLRDSQDERKVILCLTDFGKEVLHRNTSLDQEKLVKVLNQMDDSEKKLVEHALKILSERARQCM